MALPYSADCASGCCWPMSAVKAMRWPLREPQEAARFRVAVKTVKNWVQAAATAGRRGAKPLGRGPAPRLGAPECAALRQLVAADNDATLAEYGARLAAQDDFVEGVRAFLEKRRPTFGGRI